MRKQTTKFGDVLVAETVGQPQKFLLGFQIKPAARLDAAVQQANAMLQLAMVKPVFGLHAADFVDPQHLSESTQALLDVECALCRSCGCPDMNLVRATAACPVMSHACSM